MMTHDEVIGRRLIEKKDVDFEDLLNDHFINDCKMAIPSWFPIDEITNLGFEQQSCDFESGWYHRNDDPKAIMEKAHKQRYDTIFQISYAHTFAVGFCLWTRTKQED